jgi:hypothetical protein
MPEEIQLERREIAPSVRALLKTFHEDTHRKIALAPTDSPRLYQRADGRLCAVDEYGWLSDYDDLDRVDVRNDSITVEPISVRDIEDHEMRHWSVDSETQERQRDS